jgi:hypothetical protein
MQPAHMPPADNANILLDLLASPLEGFGGWDGII